MESKEKKVINEIIENHEEFKYNCSAAEFLYNNIDNIKSGNYTDDMKRYIYELLIQTVENDDSTINNQLIKLISLILIFNNDKDYHNEYWYNKIKLESYTLKVYLNNDKYYPIDENLDDIIDYCYKQLNIEYESKRKILCDYSLNLKGLKNVTIRKLINEDYIFNNFYTEEDI